MTSLGVRAFALIACLGAATLPLAACDDPDGPLEKAGEKADETVNDTKRAIEDAAD